MKIQSADFEKIITNYSKYVDRMLELDQLRIEYSNSLELIKNEMELIVKSSNTGLIVDDNLKKQNVMKFKELQSTASKKEDDFRLLYSTKQKEIMESSFNELTIIINEYAKESKFDMIVSKSQLIYVDDKFDLTDTIIDILKSKDLFYKN